MNERALSTGEIILTGDNQNSLGETRPSDTLFITNTTYIGLGLKPGLVFEKPETNSLKHATTMKENTVKT
jgi:hypothetical protein